MISKISSALSELVAFAQKNEMSPIEILSYLLKIPDYSDNLGPNDNAILEIFNSMPPDLRLNYIKLAKISQEKFALALEIHTLPTPIIKKIHELTKCLLKNKDLYESS